MAASIAMVRSFFLFFVCSLSSARIQGTPNIPALATHRKPKFARPTVHVANPIFSTGRPTVSIGHDGSSMASNKVPPRFNRPTVHVSSPIFAQTQPIGGPAEKIAKAGVFGRLIDPIADCVVRLSDRVSRYLDKQHSRFSKWPQGELRRPTRESEDCERWIIVRRVFAGVADRLIDFVDHFVLRLRRQLEDYESSGKWAQRALRRPVPQQAEGHEYNRADNNHESSGKWPQRELPRPEPRLDPNRSIFAFLATSVLPPLAPATVPGFAAESWVVVYGTLWGMWTTVHVSPRVRFRSQMQISTPLPSSAALFPLPFRSFCSLLPSPGAVLSLPHSFCSVLPSPSALRSFRVGSWQAGGYAAEILPTSRPGSRFYSVFLEATTVRGPEWAGLSLVKIASYSN
ncbi:hypothetical protein N656DRAFT_777875 [Canariomyces notabilis]|uniref:Uncharacterized protein n=1 Tax=Canariomyces notabilis TaxID=2074819 RepID=A0AAN6TGQ2_9PEZI|nr:hypothetical protein N656DRAFT_777875 [Canariomyces arenarius]